MSGREFKVYCSSFMAESVFGVTFDDGAPNDTSYAVKPFSINDFHEYKSQVDTKTTEVICSVLCSTGCLFADGEFSKSITNKIVGCWQRFISAVFYFQSIRQHRSPSDRVRRRALSLHSLLQVTCATTCYTSLC